MNIFYLDHDPKLAAQMQVDKHVVKMVMETTQLLCCAHHTLGENININDPRWGWLLGLTHKNHPCAKWARATGGNYTWLWLHGLALCEEYTHRYHKKHAYQYILEKKLHQPPLPLVASLDKRTPVALAMPDEYKVDCPVQSYRNYYKHGKRDLHVWSRRNKPDWIK